MINVVVGYGAVGSHLAKALLDRGESVRVITRSPQKEPMPSAEKWDLTFLIADMTDVESARRAVRGASVIYNAAQSPYERWVSELPPLFRGILVAAEQAGAKLVLADNLYMYGLGATQPLRESEPYRATGSKGAVRTVLTQEALMAHEQGRLQVAVARASDFFGPGVLNSALGRSVFPALVSNKTADVLGDPHVPHSYTYIKDFAETLAILGTTQAGFGRAWHVPNARAMTTHDVIADAARIAGTEGRVRTMGRAVLSLAGIFSPMLRELKETLYQFDRPFIVDSSDFETQFGQQATPLPDSLAETVRWFQSRRREEFAEKNAHTAKQESSEWHD